MPLKPSTSLLQQRGKYSALDGCDGILHLRLAHYIILAQYRLADSEFTNADIGPDFLV
jgi:hypothetical protein